MTKKIFIGLLLVTCSLSLVPRYSLVQAQSSPTTGVPMPEACKFTRSDMKDSAKIPYQSQTLVSYFKEVSEKTSVPAKVLAAIARVENPKIVEYTDQSLGSFGCPVSKTGALGLMQIQPPGTKGHDPVPINNGAKFIGRDVSNLERGDYCDIKTSIYLSAGFILKKLQYVQIGDGTKWDPSWTTNKQVITKMVEGYYGCTKYGDAVETSCTGPYDYADDVFEGVQACDEASFKASSGTSSSSSGTGSFLDKLFKSNLFITQVGNPTTPRPAGGSGGNLTSGGKAPDVEASKLKDTIKELFKVNMVGNWDTQHLQWMYEELYRVKETNFIKLIANEPVYLCDCIPNQMSGSVQMSQSGGYATDKKKFISHLFHELGHALFHHNQATENLKTKHSQLYAGAGGFTSYSTSYGKNWTGETENYAEVITYCLNKQAVGVTVNTQLWQSTYEPLAKEILGGCF